MSLGQVKQEYSGIVQPADFRLGTKVGVHPRKNSIYFVGASAKAKVKTVFNIDLSLYM